MTQPQVKISREGEAKLRLMIQYSIPRPTRKSMLDAAIDAMFERMVAAGIVPADAPVIRAGEGE